MGQGNYTIEREGRRLCRCRRPIRPLLGAGSPSFGVTHGTRMSSMSWPPLRSVLNTPCISRCAVAPRSRSSPPISGSIPRSQFLGHCGSHRGGRLRRRAVGGRRNPHRRRIRRPSHWVAICRFRKVHALQRNYRAAAREWSHRRRSGPRRRRNGASATRYYPRADEVAGVGGIGTRPIPMPASVKTQAARSTDEYGARLRSYL